MNTFAISNAMGTATLTVRVLGGQYNRMVILTDFLPLEQEELMDALSRKYLFERMTKDGEGGAMLVFHFNGEQRATLMEDIGELFADTYKERYSTI